MIRLKRKVDTVAHKASCCSGAAVARYRHAADGWEGRACELQKVVSVAAVGKIRHEQLSCIDASATSSRLFWKACGRPARRRAQRCRGPNYEPGQHFT